MTDTFNFTPDRGFSKSTKPRVLTFQFGDGYTQRTADGINPFNTTWSLSFNGRPIDEANSIIAFFENTGGYIYFFWTPPDELTQVKVVASEWGMTYDSHISRNVSVTFTRVYDL